MERREAVSRAAQLVYLIFAVIDGLLIIRLLLKLFGAEATRVYSVTAFFLAPFKNILPTIGTDQSQLEMSVVLAIIVYALIGWALGRLIAIIFYRYVTVARGSGLRTRGY